MFVLARINDLFSGSFTEWTAWCSLLIHKLVQTIQAGDSMFQHHVSFGRANVPSAKIFDLRKLTQLMKRLNCPGKPLPSTSDMAMTGIPAHLLSFQSELNASHTDHIS